MSGILKRTLYYEASPDGRIRPADYATVVTGVGTLVELCPAWFERKQIGTAMSALDMTDMCSRVDSIINTDLINPQGTFGAGVRVSYASPRTGR
jgi:hypothetical protein